MTDLAVYNQIKTSPERLWRAQGREPWELPKPSQEDQCQCAACGELFNDADAFDYHRIGEFNNTPPNYGRRCLTVAEMTDLGLIQTTPGFWKMNL